MFQYRNPKCANPACLEGFHWQGGGKFFRFSRGHGPGSCKVGEGHPDNAHHVEHFWLCEHCSQMFTLYCEPTRGVMIRPLRPESPATAEEEEVVMPVP